MSLSPRQARWLLRQKELEAWVCEMDDVREAEERARRLTDGRRRPLSIHEAGHCVVDTALGREVTEVWIDPDRLGGIVGACHTRSDGDFVDRGVGFLAGGMAELLEGPASTPQHSPSDLSQAVGVVGRDHIPAVESRARRLLVEHWAAVEDVARVLMEHGEISGPEVRRIFADSTTEPEGCRKDRALDCRSIRRGIVAAA